MFAVRTIPWSGTKSARALGITQTAVLIVFLQHRLNTHAALRGGAIRQKQSNHVWVERGSAGAFHALPGRSDITALQSCNHGLEINWKYRHDKKPFKW